MAESRNDISISNLSLSRISNLSDFNLSDDVSNQVNARDQLIEGMMQIYVRHKLTKSAIQDIAKLVNKVPGAMINVPYSKYLIFKEFMQKSELNVFIYIFCTTCKDYSKFDFADKTLVNCDNCQLSLKKSSKSFVYLEVEPQLKRIISDYYEEIKDYEIKSTNSGDTICDVSDGFFLKKLSQKEYFYSLILNTDGVQIHESSKKSLWPILLICNFLPPHIRFKERNMIIAGLHYSTEKPDFSKYFIPLVEEFKHLNQGLVINSECFKFIVSHAAFDLPAKASVQCISQFNGYNSCSYCEHPGEKTKKGVRFTFSSHPLRTHANMISDIRKVLIEKKVINGIKGLSPMVGFKHFDMSICFSIDYMHAILLNILKNLFDMWLGSENHKEPFYIPANFKRIINNRLSSIKACRFINRKIVALDQYKRFKACELRSFLLYFHPVLDGFLGKKYYNHFRLLSWSIYNLLQPSISKDDLRQANDNLLKFVEQYQFYYGKTRMTMNVHSLIHLVPGVENSGPLWAYSMFPFESFNATLKKYSGDSANVVNQIVEKIVIQTKTLNMAGKVKAEQTEYLSNKISAPNMSLQEKTAMKNYSIADCKFYASFMRRSVIYTSKLYTKAQNTLDLFVSTSDSIFGKVKFYFEYKGSNYALIEEYTSCKTFDQFNEVMPAANVSITSASKIKNKYIYMKIGLKELIVMRPNSFETN